ncbi:MAG: serine/threonine protein kinase [Gemmataceae bacterium]
MTDDYESRDEDTACPERKVLLDYQAGLLSAEQRRALDTHLSVCTLCGAALKELASDGDSRLTESLNDTSPTVGVRKHHVGKAIAETHDLEPPPQPSLPEFKIGPYLILEEIGAGGMGRVYKARHETIDQVVALKVVRLSTTLKGVLRERFRVEAGALARLEHPNIMKLYSFSDAPREPYFTMQWIDGDNLQDVLDGNPQSFREAAELIRTIAVAVEYCHQQDVYHRDLKPSNILVRRDGTPIVTDFGLAKLVDDTSTGLTVENEVMGTPNYMAPEQAEGHNEDVGPRTDIYSLGAVLYECLTGQPPYSGQSKRETLRKVREGKLLAPSKLRADLPPNLEAVCVKCLEREPRDRYATAEDLADDLTNWLNERSTKARPVGWFVRAARAIRQHRKILATAAVVITFVTLLVAVVVRDLEPEPTPDPIQPTAEELRQQALADINEKLDRGEKVTLLGDGGEPGWYEWIVEGKGSRVSRNQDSFGVTTENLTGMLELLPNARTDRYRLTCQMRHDQGKIGGKVGLYFARQGFSHSPKDIHMFLRYTFNLAGAVPWFDRTLRRQGIKKSLTVGQTSVIQLRPVVHQEEGDYPSIMGEYPGVSGDKIQMSGPLNGKWNDLELIVTPTEVSASFNGKSVVLPKHRIIESLEKWLPLIKTRQDHKDDPVVQNLQPSFDAGAGLGIVVIDGTVSVRRVVIEPLQ